MKIWLVRLGATVALAGAMSSAHATTISYDLAADWSGIDNLSGVWSVNEGANKLPFVTDYIPGTSGVNAVWSSGFSSFWGLSGNQNAWAEAPFPHAGHVPVWLQADAEFPSWPGINDIQFGDIVVHGRCCSDLGASRTNVTWTSDVSGLATISGAAWWGTTTANRNSDWDVYVNGVLVTGGTVSGSDPYSRNDPFDFANGTRGTGVLTFQTTPGATVMLAVGRDAGVTGFDHFIGVDLSIDVVVDTPEPVTLILVGLGLAGLGAGRRRS